MAASRLAALAAAVACVGQVASFTSGHELLVGRSAANQILLHLESDHAFELPESTFPGFEGFAAADPGYVATDQDVPGEGLFILPPTCDLEFILLDATEHIQVWNDSGSAPMLIGESYHVGVPLFHTHPLWHSPDGVPGEIYSLTMRLRDRNGVLTDSEPFTIEFEVAVSIPPGDIDGDGHVDLADLAMLLSAFGSCFGDAGFLANADLNDDGCVGLPDLATVLANFGS